MKKEIKKGISILLAAALGVGVCTSCGMPKQSENEGKVKLVVGEWPIEGKDLELMNTRKDNFEKANSNVEIVPDTWKFDLRSFYPKAEGGTLPDIFASAFTEVDKLLDGGYAYDVTELLKENGYYDNMNEAVRNVVSRDGKVYAIPYSVYNFGIACNMDMYEKAGLLEDDGTPKQPKDWEELAQFAVKIKEATGKPGFVLCTADNCGGWMLTNIAWSYGVDFMEQQEDGKWKATFDTEEMVQVLQFVKDLKWKYDVLPSNVLVNQEEMFKIFAMEQAGMMLTSPPHNKLAKYDMEPEKLGMVGIPAGPVKRVSLLGGAFRVLSNKVNEKQAEVALKWIEHIGSGCAIDDNVKKTMQENMQTNLENGYAVGVKALSVWSDDSEKRSYSNQLIDENYNMKPNAVKLYNESLISGEVELQPEEPVCAQDLYGLLDACIQQVLNDENADCAAIVKKANTDFQVNYLNNIDY